MAQETESKPARGSADGAQGPVWNSKPGNFNRAGNTQQKSASVRQHASRNIQKAPQNKNAEADSRHKKRQQNRKTRQPKYKNVGELPEEVRELINRMLIQGSTFEDVFEAVEEIEPNNISRAAIEIYFRSNAELQQNRVRTQLETAQKLKSACADPESAQSELAEAMILTGLMGVKRATKISDSQYALRSKAQQENYRLKEQVLQLQIQKSALDSEMLKVRIRHENEKLKLVGGKVEQLQRLLERQGASKTLTPEMLRSIQEIYGIVTEESTVATTM